MKVICLSGGMDSTVLAYKLKHEGEELYSLTFHYGQSHYCETLAAKRIADALGIPARCRAWAKCANRG